MFALKRLYIISFILILQPWCGIEVGNPGGGDKPKVTLIAEGAEGVTSKTGRYTIDASVEVTDYRLALRDFRFEGQTKTDFSGPFFIQLLDENSSVATEIGVGGVSKGTYDRIRVDLHKSSDLGEANPLFERSLFIAGTIDSIPFELWHDTGETFEIRSSTSIQIDDDSSLKLLFSIEDLLDGVDLAQAVDGDGDGIIEINPDDADESDVNAELADQVKDNLEQASELLKD